MIIVVKINKTIELDNIDVTEDPVRPELDVKWRTSHDRKIYKFSNGRRLDGTKNWSRPVGALTPTPGLLYPMDGAQAYTTFGPIVYWRRYFERVGSFKSQPSTRQRRQAHTDASGV